MQPMSFRPAVGDLGAQVADLGKSALEAAEQASASVTGLAPAGADEISAQAVTAFHTEAASALAANKAAQEELVRAGTAVTQIAHTYTDVDETIATTLVFGPTPLMGR